MFNRNYEYRIEINGLQFVYPYLVESNILCFFNDRYILIPKCIQYTSKNLLLHKYKQERLFMNNSL